MARRRHPSGSPATTSPTSSPGWLPTHSVESHCSVLFQLPSWAVFQLKSSRAFRTMKPLSVRPTTSSMRLFVGTKHYPSWAGLVPTAHLDAGLPGKHLNHDHTAQGHLVEGSSNVHGLTRDLHLVRRTADRLFSAWNLVNHCPRVTAVAARVLAHVEGERWAIYRRIRILLLQHQRCLHQSIVTFPVSVTIPPQSAQVALPSLGPILAPKCPGAPLRVPPVSLAAVTGASAGVHLRTQIHVASLSVGPPLVTRRSSGRCQTPSSKAVERQCHAECTEAQAFTRERPPPQITPRSCTLAVSQPLRLHQICRRVVALQPEGRRESALSEACYQRLHRPSPPRVCRRPR